MKTIKKARESKASFYDFFNDKFVKYIEDRAPNPLYKNGQYKFIVEFGMYSNKVAYITDHYLEDDEGGRWE